MVALLFTGAHKEELQLVVQFNHVINGRALTLDTATYYNALAQPYTVTKFKYYISQITLTDVNGKEYCDSASYLIDEEEPESKKVVLHLVPQANYKQISFLIGVDSLRNCSGAQEGALDPMHGMFWTWNTGYIFMKLEGRSPDSKATAHLLEYHIGGYKAPANSIRRVTLSFSAVINPLTTNGYTISIDADAGELLQTPTTVDFSKLPAVTDFHNAEMLADNYKDMFRLSDTK